MAELQQKLQRRRKGQLVSKSSAGDEQTAGKKDKRPDVALLMAVETGRDKQPKLQQDVRRSQEDAAHNGELDVEIKGVDRVGIDQLVRQVQAAQRVGERARQ